MMDRNEIALRFAVAYLTTPHAPHVVPPWTEPHDVVAREAFNRADAFLAASAPKDAPGPSQPATVASEAAPARPDWVRVVSKNGWESVPLTVNKVYRVERWTVFGRPEVRNDEGGCWELSLRGDKPDDKFETFASWVPAEPPAPSSPPSCGAPPQTAPYVPAPGDVFAWGAESDAAALTTYVRVCVAPGLWSSVPSSCGLVNEPITGSVRYIRHASASERAAAGLPPAEREGRSPECREAADQAPVDEAKEREAATKAYREGADGSVDMAQTYTTCRDSFVNGWLARARAAAPTAPRSVDREGLAKAMRTAAEAWRIDYMDRREFDQVYADAAIAFLNGGAK